MEIGNLLMLPNHKKFKLCSSWLHPIVFYNYGTILRHSRVCDVYEMPTKMKMSNTHY
jgi:hypothetical protein